MLRVSSFLTKSPPKRSIQTDKIQADIKGKPDAKNQSGAKVAVEVQASQSENYIERERKEVK